MKNIKINDFGDSFQLTPINPINTKEMIEVWDEIEIAVEKLINTIAINAGVTNIEWNDLSAIKEVTEKINHIITERFNVSIPPVEVDF